VDDQVLEQNNETALGRADSKEQVDHSDDCAVAPEHENASAAWLFENQPQAAKLFLFVRAKVAFLGKQLTEHFGQFIQVGLGCWLNYDILAHCLYRLFQKLDALAISE